MSTKKYPGQVKFFIGDDIRADGSKPIIIGLIPDDFVRIEMPLTQADPSQNAPLILQGLAILVSFIDCKGPFRVEYKLYQPNGNPLLEQPPQEAILDSDPENGRDSINFIARLVPLPIPEFGEYRFVIKLDDKEYTYKIRVNRAGKLA